MENQFINEEMKLKQKTKQFVEKVLRGYYKFNFSPKIDDIGKREFGMFSLKQPETMWRHLTFNDEDSLKKFIHITPPLHLYHSVSMYEYPGNPDIGQKKIIDGEFVIDIDADHFNLPCQKEHGKDIICAKCFNAAKHETIKTYNVLMNEMAIHQDYINIHFSGHRGFHIIITQKNMRNLPSEVRAELCDYLTVKGYDRPTFKSFKMSNHVLHVGANLPNSFSGKIIKTFKRLMRDGGWEDMDEAIRSNLKYYYGYIMNQLSVMKHPILAIKEMTKEMWEKVYQRVIDETRCHIDVPVSIDTRRLIRTPGSVHGKTGLRVVPIEIDNLEDFHPAFDATMFNPVMGEDRKKIQLEFPKENGVVPIYTQSFDPVPIRDLSPFNKFHLKDAIYLILHEGAEVV